MNLWNEFHRFTAELSIFLHQRSTNIFVKISSKVGILSGKFRNRMILKRNMCTTCPCACFRDVSFLS